MVLVTIKKALEIMEAAATVFILTFVKAAEETGISSRRGSGRFAFLVWI